MGAPQAVLVLFLFALATSGVLSSIQIIKPEVAKEGLVSVQSSGDQTGLPLVNITRWGGCGWLGRPCFRIQINSGENNVQYIAVDKIPSVQLKSDEIELKL